MQIKNKKILGISRNVAWLSLVSLLNDIASEMIYPLLPLFLTTTLGAPMWSIGLIDGTAELLAGITKAFSGWLSDKFQSRKSFVVAGYSISAVAKVLYSTSYNWLSVFAARSVDRLGKGLRTPARDALISLSSAPENKGRSFGFHRATDTLGAVIGPLCAMSLLYLFGMSLRVIFFISFIPSCLSIILLVLYVQDGPTQSVITTNLFSFQSLSRLGSKFYLFLGISTIFSLGNSSQFFMILKARQLGFQAVGIICLYVLYNVSYSAFSAPLGILADRIGPKKIIVTGWLLFAFVYLLFAFITTPHIVWILFPLFGVYMALTDGIGHAYIAVVAPQDMIGTSYGTYQTVLGICSFVGSFVAGLLWHTVNSAAPFLFGASMAFLATFIFVVTKKVS